MIPRFDETNSIEGEAAALWSSIVIGSAVYCALFVAGAIWLISG